MQGDKEVRHEDLNLKRIREKEAGQQKRKQKIVGPRGKQRPAAGIRDKLKNEIRKKPQVIVFIGAGVAP